jgi:ATP-dependent protease ClpP protease subunit
MIFDVVLPKYVEDVTFKHEPCSIEVGEIDEDMLSDFQESLEQAMSSPQSIIPIIIHSTGGDVYTLMAMLGLVEEAKKTKIVATVCMGSCFSAAAVLFSEGTKGYRYMSPHGTLMIHDIAISEIDGKLGNVEAESKEMRRLNNILYERMATNCNKNKNFFKKKADTAGHTDMYINSTTAVKWKLADHERIPRFQMRFQISETVDKSVLEDDEVAYPTSTRGEVEQESTKKRKIK